MSRTTHANGIKLRPRGFDSQPARRLATDFERDPSNVQYIKCNKFGPPVVRLDVTRDETFSFDAPDGWAVSSVCVTEENAVFVSLERDD